MDVDEGGPPEGSSFETTTRFMPNAVVIPGALHICSNLCKDVSSKLAHWDVFLKELALFESLLCHRDRRERFLSTCVPATAEERTLFKSFSGSLYEKRWGAVVSFLRKFVPLIGALKKFWNHDKYVEGYQQRANAGGEADDGVGASFVAADLTRALFSNMFNVYVSMVLSLFNIVENLASWFEGCQCHEQQLQQHGNKIKRASKKETSESGPYAFCPMKGKRAPELAAGALGETFETLLSSRKASLLRKMSEQQLSQENEALVLQDFDAGKNYIQLGLQVKLDFWTKFPWRLAALGHRDTDVARAAAVDMLEKSIGLGLGVPDPDLVHHPTTVKFLAPASPLRPLLEAFAEGQPMSDALRIEAAKLSFMPVVERSIESKHSLISRRVQKQWRSGRIVSLTLRVPDIKAEVAADASFLQDLTKAFALTRDPVGAAKQLGIHEHPELMKACFDNTHKASRVGIVNRIVYRCDLESKFETHSAARVQHDQTTRKRARLADQAMQQIVAPPEPGRQPRGRPAPEACYESVLRLAIQDHFARTASSATSSRVYSLDLAPDKNGCLPSLQPLDSVLEGKMVSGACSRGELPALLPDVAEYTSPHEAMRFQDCQVVHFQVIHASPNQMHTVPLARGAGKRLSKGEIAVSVHSFRHHGVGNRRITLEPVAQGKTCVAILSDVAAGDLGVLQETFTQFDLGPLVYNVKGFAPRACQTCCEAITELVRQGAFPDSDVHCRVTLDAGCPPQQWVELEAAGLVHGVLQDDGAVKSFVLTPSAVEALEVVVELVEPRLVCEPRSDLPLEDCTTYELIRKLECAGWSWARLPSNSAKRKALRHSADSEKIWYSAGGLPHPLYLQCLLEAERLGALGVVSIPHCSPKPAATYRQLLQGRCVDMPLARPRLMLQGDVDLGEAEDLPCLQDEAAAGEEANDPETMLEPERDAGIQTRDEQILELLQLFDDSEPEMEVESPAAAAPVAHDPELVDEPVVPSPSAGGVAMASSSAMVPAIRAPAEASGSGARADDAERKPAVRRLVQPGVVSSWGCFRISSLVPKPNTRAYGALEAVCPFHRKNSKTECKKYVAHKSNDQASKDLDYKALMHWCSQAQSVNRQKHHVGMQLLSRERVAEIPMEVLEARRIEQGPSQPAVADDVLDAEGAEDGPSEPRAAAPPAVARRVRGKRAPAEVVAPAVGGVASGSVSSSSSSSSNSGSRALARDSGSSSGESSSDSSSSSISSLDSSVAE